MAIADYEVTLQELSYIKDYGWNRYAMSKQDTNVNFDWVRQNFALYHEVIQDSLFNAEYGYYSAGIVKIGGVLSDYNSNGSRNYGSGLILIHLVFNQWLEQGKSTEFWIVELSGGNGKPAGRILTMLKNLALHDAEFAEFWQAIQ